MLAPRRPGRRERRDAALVFDGVWHERRGGAVVLRGVDLAIAPGERVLIIDVKAGYPADIESVNLTAGRRLRAQRWPYGSVSRSKPSATRSSTRSLMVRVTAPPMASPERMRPTQRNSFVKSPNIGLRRA